MVSDLDIYRSANELIKQHGEDAPSLSTAHDDGHKLSAPGHPRTATGCACGEVEGLRARRATSSHQDRPVT